MSIGSCNVFHNKHQIIFNIITTKPESAKSIYQYFRSVNYSDDIQYTASLIEKCKDIAPNALSCLTSENLYFLKSLDPEITEFMMQRINEFDDWKIIIDYLKNHDTLTIPNLEAVENNQKVIAEALDGKSKLDKSVNIYNFITQHPGQSGEIIAAVYNPSNKPYYGYRIANFIRTYKITDTVALKEFTDENVNVFVSAEKESLDFIMTKLSNYATWKKVIDYLFNGYILNINNLQKVEPYIEKISTLISDDNKLTGPQAQQFFDFIIKHQAILDTPSFKYLTIDNIKIIQNSPQDEVAFILARINNYDKWEKIVAYLYDAEILTITNLNLAETHLDMLFDIVDKDKTKKTSKDTAQNVFRFMIDNPPHAKQLFFNPDQYDALTTLLEKNPNQREVILQNTKYVGGAQSLVAFSAENGYTEELDNHFIVNNLETAHYLFICLELLKNTNLSDYYPNVISLKDHPEMVKSLAKALESTSESGVIVGGKDTFEIVIQFPFQFDKILSKLKTKGLSTRANFNSITLKIEHIDNIQKALEIFQEEELSQDYFIIICTHAEYAVNIVKALIILYDKRVKADMNAILTNPRYAHYIASALSIIGNKRNNYRQLIIENPQYSIRLMKGINELGIKVNEALPILKAHSQYADKLGAAYIKLLSLNIKSDEALALMDAHPEHALDIANALLKSTPLPPNAQFFRFIQKNAQHAASIDNVINSIISNSTTTKKYLPLLMLSFELETKDISKHPLYLEFSKLEDGSHMDVDMVMIELAQMNCSFANLILGKIFSSYDFKDLYQPNKAIVFLNMVPPDTAWYFIAQRLMFDLLLNECHHLKDKQDYADTFNDYKDKLNKTVKILIENSQQGPVLQNIESYSRTSEFAGENKFVLLPDIAANSISADKKKCSVSTQTVTWDELLEQAKQQTRNNDPSNSSIDKPNLK